MKTFWSRIRYTVRRLFYRASTEQGLGDEIQSYIQHEIDSRIEAGADRAEARRTALAEFGGVEHLKEEIRANRTGAWFDSLRQDFEYAFRSFKKSKTFSLAVIGSLGIGMAVTVVGFAVVNALVIPKFPGVKDPDRLVSIFVNGRCGADNCWVPSTILEHEAMQIGLTTLDGFASTLQFPITAGFNEPKSVQAQFVSEDYFEVLGMRPTIGRLFASGGTDFINAGAVISHKVWVREYGGDRNIVGKSVRIANRSIPILGVAPKGFGGVPDSLLEMWLPFPLASVVTSSKVASPIIDLALRSIGRMKDGVDDTRLLAEAEVVFGQIAAERARPTKKGRILLHDMATSRFQTVGFVTIILLVPMLVLCISCLNAANLMMSRSVQRTREIAIRLAIGASRARVVRQILVECLILAIASAVVSLLLARWILQLVESVFPVAIPIDPIVLGLTLLTAFICTIQFGLGPAMRMTSQNPTHSLGTSHATAASPDMNRKGNRDVAIQIGLCLGLLVAGQELLPYLKRPWGTSVTPPDRLLLTSFDLNQLQIQPSESEVFYRDLLDRASKLPQVEVAAIGPQIWWWGRKWHIDSVISVWLDDKNMRQVKGGVMTPRLFQTLGIRVMEGRGFEVEDFGMREPQVAIVSLAFARKWVDGNVVGRTIRVANMRDNLQSAVEVRIVGVVESLKDRLADQDGMHAVYLPAPIHEAPQARMLYVIQRENTRDVAPAIRNVVHLTDDRVPIIEFGTLQHLNEQYQGEGWLGVAVEWLGLVSLLLATSGLFSVVSHSVSKRFREISIRMTVGANPKDILVMVLRQAVGIAVGGALTGAFVAETTTNLIRFWNNIPVEINWTAFGRSSAELMVALFLATIIPATRAARVDPLVNLKEQ